MGSKWYRFINGVFGGIYSFALGTLLYEVPFSEDDVAMFVVSDFLCVICFDELRFRQGYPAERIRCVV